MKLTINHLCPYLPYGLQMINTKSGRIIDVRGLRETVSTFIIEATVKSDNGINDEDYQSDLWPLKPLLIPLSELTISKNGNEAPLTYISFEYFGFGKGYVSEPEFKLINENGFIGFQSNDQGIYFVRQDTNWGISTYFNYSLKVNGLWIPQKVTSQL